jgi:manganese/zinc/iron transport system permease protein
MAMVGDAISHGVLPGIVVAFLVTGTRDSLVMVLGAGILGMITTFIIEFLHKKGNLQSDASIGVTFTLLFAIGVILISVFAGDVDLDLDCVLNGEIAYVPLDLIYLPSGVSIGPKVVITLTVVLLAVLVFIISSYKELKVTSFDPDYALAIGLPVATWHYLLMGAVSVTTVASFEAVGAILVVAFLIAPPAIAYLFTQNLKQMLILTAIIGVVVSILGYGMAAVMNASISGAMATICGILFVIAMLFNPETGILRKKKLETND